MKLPLERLKLFPFAFLSEIIFHAIKHKNVYEKNDKICIVPEFLFRFAVKKFERSLYDASTEL